jgi:hypothetical protein
MEQCPRCDNPVRPNDVFCEECGIKLRQDQSPPASKPGFQLPVGLGSWKTLRWVIVIVGCISVILGALSGVSGMLFIQRLLGPQVAVTVVKEIQVVTATPTHTPTRTPGPSPTPTITHTPTPTVTPRPTNTPTPTPTPIPTTQPGTVLEPGEFWYEDGLALRMELVSLKPDVLRIDLVLDNLEDDTMMFELNNGMFRLVSNLGDVVHPKPYSWSGFRYGSVALEPGERLELAKNGFINYNLANQDVTHVFIEVVGVSRIDRARWRVDIPH